MQFQVKFWVNNPVLNTQLYLSNSEDIRASVQQSEGEERRLQYQIVYKYTALKDLMYQQGVSGRFKITTKDQIQHLLIY